jgi:RNA polymerase subunit RPABC4/transcription elongation factor Spt4
MLIRCIACKKLFYFDDAPRENACPACGSEHTDQIAMSIVFGRSTGDVDTSVAQRASTSVPPAR